MILRRCPRLALSLAAVACFGFGPAAVAFTFTTDNINGAFDSTVTAAFGLRTKNPSCDLVTAGATGPNAPAGCLAPTSALGDQGDLNYGKGDLFLGQIKGTHELVLKMPEEQLTFMARGNWVRDFAATHTTGIESGAAPLGLQGNLAEDARKDLAFKGRLLDLWVSKGFQIGDQQARVRLGNQVISWGESLFLPGGINATNSLDLMRLAQPGTQLKEAYLPVPILSFASGIPGGFNMEAYVQGSWNEDYFPPIGSYWNTTFALGKGHDTYGFRDVSAKNWGQWGVSLRYQPEGRQVNFGLYVVEYHDKLPQLSFNAGRPGFLGAVYPENRMLYGASTNFRVGDWAIGGEVSYRPKDAVALNANTGCIAQAGNCWVDESRIQTHLTALLSLTSGGTGGTLLRWLHADTATLLSEAAMINYPGLKSVYSGTPISAGGYGWGQETNSSASAVPVGTTTSSGFNFDFSWVYDGKVIPGWQVQPEVYYFIAMSGRTPNVTAEFMSGAQSANFILSFIQNPTKWQAAINYAKFWGGSSPFDQPFHDRDFFGAYVQRNF
jgi:Protein of unknown function (DUF1302)